MAFAAGITAIFDVLPFSSEGFAPTEGVAAFGTDFDREDLFYGHGVLNF